jgi:hypothetical protein
LPAEEHLVAASKTLTPAERSERARKAAQVRHSLDTYVNAVVAKAPELNDAQRAKLRALFAPAEVA